MDGDNKLTWSALEYEEKSRSTDWFWALGIIIVAGSITAIIYENYFFAMLIIIGGILLGFFAIKKPENVPYELNEKGFQIKNRLYPYDSIKAFWIQDTPKHTFFIKSSRQFLPMLSIPITEDLSLRIKNIMLSKDVAEEEMKEHPSDRIMESLGF